MLPGGNAVNATNTGLLNVGSLAIAGSSTLGFKAANGSNYDQINVTNALSITGGNISLNLYSPNGAGQFYGTGTFTLINDSGSFSGTSPSAAFSVGNPLSDLTYTLGTSGNNLTLTVGLAAANSVWNGGSSATGAMRGTGQTGPPTSSSILRFDGSNNLATNNDQAGRTYAGMLFYTTAGSLHAQR